MDMSSHLHAACTLRHKLGTVLREVDGSAAAALEHENAVLKMRQRLHGEGDHPDIATSMNNLASTLHHLGKHQQALEMQEEVLKMRQRLYPEGDHPKIAESMNNLA